MFANELKIIEAVQAGDVAQVTQLLEQGVSPDSQSRANKSLLYLATEANDLVMVDLLLNRGAQVDFPFTAQSSARDKAAIKAVDPTPLLYAAAHGQTAIVERLLHSQPNLLIRNFYGGNALIPAAEKGHYDTAVLLLEQTHIDVDFVNYLGWSALLEVVLLSKDPDMQIKMAQLLVKHGANVHLPDADGKSSLQHAKDRNLSQLVALFETENKLP